MDSRLWAETMVGLNDAGMRTVAYDRRGHGFSSDSGEIDYDLLANDLATVIATLDLHDVTLVAHSGASGEAIRYLSRHGDERIRHLVLVGATGPYMMAAQDNLCGVPREAAETLLGELAHDLAGWIDRNAEPFAPGVPDRLIQWLGQMIMDVSRRTFVDFQRAILETDFRDEAAALHIPVTLIHGDMDASAPIELTAHVYARIVPGAELIVYEGAPHGLMYTERARFTGELAAIVESAGQQGLRRAML
jgi:pimeloyl-ACP methyl ester carboxylesterase